MLQIWFRPLREQKFRLMGDDGNEFEGATEAWAEAQTAANLGIPWAGATFQLVDVTAGDHSDDCALGLGVENGCDCGIEPLVVEERVLFSAGPPKVVKSPVPGEQLRVWTRRLADAEKEDLGLGGMIAVEGIVVGEKARR